MKKTMKMKQAVKLIAKMYLAIITVCVVYRTFILLKAKKDVKLDKKVEAIMHSAINDCMNVLKLKQRPDIEIVDSTDERFVMMAMGEFTYNPLTRAILQCENANLIKVNVTAIEQEMQLYYQKFGKQAGYDYIYLSMCHEMRHLWQYETGWYIGKQYNPAQDELTRNISGHGSLDEEVDANQFATKMAIPKGIQALAEFMEATQRIAGLLYVDSNTRRTIRNKATEVAKYYRSLR